MYDHWEGTVTQLSNWNLWSSPRALKQQEQNLRGPNIKSWFTMFCHSQMTKIVQKYKSFWKKWYLEISRDPDESYLLFPVPSHQTRSAKVACLEQEVMSVWVWAIRGAPRVATQHIPSHLIWPVHGMGLFGYFNPSIYNDKYYIVF